MTDTECTMCPRLVEDDAVLMPSMTITECTMCPRLTEHGVLSWMSLHRYYLLAHQTSTPSH